MVTQHHQGFNLSGEEGDAYFPSMCYFVETLTATFARWGAKRTAGIGVAASQRAPQAIN
jgi:hypothetical protein